VNALITRPRAGLDKQKSNTKYTYFMPVLLAIPTNKKWKTFQSIPKQ